MPEAPLKIALLGSRGIPASYSGFETFYEQLAVRLAARGHSVTVYNRAHHIDYRDDTYRGVDLVRLPSIQSKHLDTISHTVLSMLHAIPRNYDIFYVCIVGNSPACVIPRLLRKPVILNVDGADAERDKWQGFAKTYLRWSERTACRVANVVIADSPVISERYDRLYGRETVYIPYGANVWPREREESTAVLERFGLEPDRYVLFVSRLTPENAAHVAIEAHKNAGTGLKLVVVGDAPYSEGYKAYLHSLCDDTVVMTGYLFGEDYRQISCHCRFFVLPSAIDGTRPVLLDQMGFGNCVLVRNTPANMHVIGDAGESFEHEDEIASLRSQFIALSGDDDLVGELRRRALERAADHFSWERVTDQYEGLFYSLAGHQS